MERRIFRWAMAVALMCSSLGFAQNAPYERAASQPSTRPFFHVSPMIVKSVSPIEAFLYGQATTTLPQMQQTLGQTFAPLTQAARAGTLRVAGPAIFVYYGASADPTRSFRLETGFPVPQTTEPFGDFKRRGLPAFRCASVYYTGPLLHMGQAYPELFGQIFRAGQQPTDEIREVYLLWEGPQSPNNVVEIQVGLQEPSQQ